MRECWYADLDFEQLQRIQAGRHFLIKALPAGKRRVAKDIRGFKGSVIHGCRLPLH